MFGHSSDVLEHSGVAFFSNRLESHSSGFVESFSQELVGKEVFIIGSFSSKEGSSLEFLLEVVFPCSLDDVSLLEALSSTVVVELADSFDVGVLNVREAKGLLKAGDGSSTPYSRINKEDILIVTTFSGSESGERVELTEELLPRLALLEGTMLLIASPSLPNFCLRLTRGRNESLDTWHVACNKFISATDLNFNKGDGLRTVLSYEIPMSFGVESKSASDFLVRVLSSGLLGLFNAVQ